MNSRIVCRWLAVALAACLLAAVCGSSSDDDSSSEPTSQNAKPTGDPYVVGFSAGLTGPDAPYGTSNLEALTAYFAPFNDKGGINGHPIKVVSLDSHGDTPTAVNNFTSLARTSGASIVAGEEISSAGDAVVQRANAFKVPFVASSASANIVEQDYGFSVGLALPQSATYEFDYIKTTAKPGDKVELATVATSSSAGDELVAQVNKLAAANDYPVKTTQRTPLPPPDTMVPVADAVNSSGANYVVGGIQDAGSLDILLVHALQALDWKGQVVNFFGGNSLTTLETLNVPWYVVAQPFSYTTESNAGVQKMVTQVKDGGGDPDGIFSNVGWTQGAIIAAAFDKCGFPCPGTKMKTALEGLGDIGTLDGFAAGPIKLTPTQHHAVTYAKMYAYLDGKPKPVSKAVSAPFPIK